MCFSVTGCMSRVSPPHCVLGKIQSVTTLNNMSCISIIIVKIITNCRFYAWNHSRALAASSRILFSVGITFTLFVVLVYDEFWYCRKQNAWAPSWSCWRGTWWWSFGVCRLLPQGFSIANSWSTGQAGCCACACLCMHVCVGECLGL